MSSTRVSQHIDAPRERIYRLLLDPTAIAQWKVPEGMTAHVHTFDAREGGAIRISLTYLSPNSSGKTTEQTDTYHGRFVRLVPDALVVEADEFETDDPALRGEMISTITLTDAPDGGTDVTGMHESLPSGLNAADNETGWRMALAKLAALAEQPLGLERGVVRLAPHHAAWSELFAHEAERLRTVLDARGLALAFEHMGSTAVPGLVAKPIIDMLAGWRDERDRPHLIAALEAAGYTYRGEQGIAGRDYFRRGNPRKYHLHLAELGGPFWRDHLDFRNALRTHPAIAADYAALKYDLAQRFPNDRERYIDGKTAFVERVLGAARANDAIDGR